MSDKLTSPFPGLAEDDADYLHAKIPKPLFNYFFRSVLPGDRGCRQILVQIFFQKLYESCQLAGIPSTWDITNESRVAAIVSKLNFTDVAATIREGNRIGKSSPVVVGPERPARSGRTRQPTSKSTTQPASGSNERTGTPRARPTTSHSGDLGSNPVSEAGI